MFLYILVPPPNVSISIPDTKLFAGSTVNLTCHVMLIREIDIDVILNVTWFKEGTVIANKDDTEMIPSALLPSNSFTRILTVSPLSAIENNITCSAKVSPSDETSFIEESPIQSSSELLTIKSKSLYSIPTSPIKHWYLKYRSHT